MSIAGNGDKLASGRAKSATYSGAGYGEGELKPSLAAEGDIPETIDNSALFAPKVPESYYTATPFNKRVLLTRFERKSNSDIIIPDSAKEKSEVGIVVSFSPDSDLAKQGMKVGSMVMFDRFAAVGRSYPLMGADGEVKEHVLVQEADIDCELFEIRTANLQESKLQ